MSNVAKDADELPEIPSAGDRYIDLQIRNVLAAKGTKYRSVGYVRALALQGLARLYAHALKLKDDEIAALKARVAKLEELAGGEGAVKELEELREDFDSKLEEKTLEALGQQGKKVWDGVEPLTGSATELVERVRSYLGHESIDESIELYELRRAAEDVSGDASAALDVLDDIPLP